MKLKATTALLALMLASSAPLAQQGAQSDNARIEKFKTTVIEGVEARRKLAQVMNDTVFSFGELAYQEFETSKYLTEVLEKNGFKVERGVAGMPTAWVARWGSLIATSSSPVHPGMARATIPDRRSTSSPRSQ